MKTLVRTSAFSLLAVLCVGLVIVTSCIVALVNEPDRHPTDQQMIDNYTQHKMEFNQLAHMLIVEKELRVIFPDGNGKCQVEGQKLIDSTDDDGCAEYVRLFRLLGLDWTYVRPEPLRLRVSAQGYFLRGTTKGYVYTSESPIPPGTIVSDTNSKGLPIPRYKHIEGNWYIYLE